MSFNGLYQAAMRKHAALLSNTSYQGGMYGGNGHPYMPPEPEDANGWTGISDGLPPMRGGKANGSDMPRGLFRFLGMFNPASHADQKRIDAPVPGKIQGDPEVPLGRRVMRRIQETKQQPLRGGRTYRVPAEALYASLRGNYNGNQRPEPAIHKQG